MAPSGEGRTRAHDGTQPSEPEEAIGKRLVVTRWHGPTKDVCGTERAGTSRGVISQTMRLRLTFAVGAGLLVLLAFVFGVSVIAALFTRTSESTPYVSGGVFGR